MFKKRLILGLALLGASCVGYFVVYGGLALSQRSTSVAAAEQAFEDFIERTERCERFMAEFARSFGEDASEVNFLRSASRISGETDFLCAEWLTRTPTNSFTPRYTTRTHGPLWKIAPVRLRQTVARAADTDWTQTTNVIFSSRFGRDGEDVVALVCPVPDPIDLSQTNGYAVAYFRVSDDANHDSPVSIRVQRQRKGRSRVIYPSQDDGVGQVLFSQKIEEGPVTYLFEFRERDSLVESRGRLALLGLLLGPFFLCSLLRLEWQQTAAYLESRNEGLLSENAEQRELQRTLQSLLKLREQERRLVSSDIHDGFVQEAISAQMFLDALATRVLDDPIANKQLSSARRAVEQAVREGRQLVNRNSVLAVDEYGFLPALQRIVSQQEDFGVQVVLRFPPELPELDIQLQRSAYRIIQESLCNVRRHSEVLEATVSLSFDNEWLFIDIVDQGRGFDMNNVETGSFGMRGIRERAEVLGGEAIIKSEVGEGTIVQVRLPLLRDIDASVVTVVTNTLDSQEHQ